ncbi:MAG: polysaccharide deacetylase family protein [Actinomycetota bacterium]
MITTRLNNRRRDAVFLCFHSVADKGPPFLSVRPEAFERQLAILKRLRFRSGTLADIDRLARGERPDAKLVFLTFDDGYRDNYLTARPLLDAYGFRALVFLIPPQVDRGDTLEWPRVERHAKAYPDVMRALTWTMVEEMAADGHQFGSHTLTHPSLPEVGGEQLRQELSDSRARIAERLGSCEAIAYPFGHWTQQIADAAGEIGYSYGLTLPDDSQLGASPLSIPRIPIDHRDDERLFRLKLTPQYRSFLLSPLKPAARWVLRHSRARQRTGVSVAGAPTRAPSSPGSGSS